MKKLLLTASGIFLAASLYIGINSYKNINSVSDLLLANVEALADGEGATQIPCNPGGSRCIYLVQDASGNLYLAATNGFYNI